MVQVKGVYDALPEADKPNTVLLTGNYGEAGAVDRYGGRYGLPTVYSGHRRTARDGIDHLCPRTAGGRGPPVRGYGARDAPPAV